METYSKNLKLTLLAVLSLIGWALYAQPTDENTETTAATTARYETVITDGRISAATELYTAILCDGITTSEELFRLMQKNPKGYVMSQKQLMEVGEKLSLKGHLQESIAVLGLTASVFPDAWEVSEKMGEVYILAGNTAAAENCFDKASDIKARHEMKDTFFGKVQL